ncbi:hypothetical protein GXM_07490 [Nostoc sphaeroides CCNUC1]|uniref:Uncharacterized protein n=1 Tax=Nostoc sphaeroides CCNUC1 TaxID=2653204 RepID=A0A5P8WCV8_9NOSO|nr:hypothetical protein GXM_07490 [Nostoc sphaeroides CCNUC1]
MAIGKCEDDKEINQEKVVIKFDYIQVYPDTSSEEKLKQLQKIMSKEKVNIHISLNIGEAAATVWGCDLSEGYIDINGKYST